jgi:hypothetical protein
MDSVVASMHNSLLIALLNELARGTLAVTPMLRDQPLIVFSVALTEPAAREVLYPVMEKLASEAGLDMATAKSCAGRPYGAWVERSPPTKDWA